MAAQPQSAGPAPATAAAAASSAQGATPLLPSQDAAAPLAEPASLLDRLLSQPPGQRAAGGPHTQPLAELLSADRDTALRLLFGPAPRITRKDAARRLDMVTARLEALLSEQVNTILHHPRLQALEASWRGVEYLCDQAREHMEAAEEQEHTPKVLLRIFCASKRELLNDAQEAAEFDQTALWRAVYEAEFGTAGGTPFGLLVGDYEFSGHQDDLDALRSIAQVSAASFAPFVAAASPQFFGLDDFQRLPLRPSLAQNLQGPDGIKWRSLRESEDARFIGLTVPRVLMRVPYRLDVTRYDGFRFQEAVAEDGRHVRYLWGNAAYAFGAVVLRAFIESSWFAEIRGFERGQQSGGLVAGLASDSFSTDRPGIARKTSTDIVIGGGLERELSELGFIPLCPCQGTEYSVFYSNASIQQPKTYSDAAATTTAKMSAMLQYILCASRFAHFLKSICREKLGGNKNADEIHDELNRWISQFVADDPMATPETRARFPLRRAELAVTEIPGTAGGYRLEMQLLPHYQLDALSASLKLVDRRLLDVRK